MNTKVKRISFIVLTVFLLTMSIMTAYAASVSRTVKDGYGKYVYSFSRTYNTTLGIKTSKNADATLTNINENLNVGLYIRMYSKNTKGDLKHDVHVVVPNTKKTASNSLTRVGMSYTIWSNYFTGSGLNIYVSENIL